MLMQVVQLRPFSTLPTMLLLYLIYCIGEHFLFNRNGGAAAFIGNTSLGWYVDGNVFMYSGEFDTLFYKILAFGEERRLGNVFTDSRIPFISYENDPYR